MTFPVDEPLHADLVGAYRLVVDMAHFAGLVERTLEGASPRRLQSSPSSDVA